MHKSHPRTFLFTALRIIPLSLCLIMAYTQQPSASEPVEVRVIGLEGDPLKNVEAALILPPGLVKDNTVDKLWLEHFNRQAESKALKALEPYGYYKAQVKSVLEEKTKGEYLLLVTVAAGKATNLTAVEVELQGPGAEEEALVEKARRFPLRPGDRLNHDIYEKAKNDILVSARELGYLDADFTVHEVRVDPEAESAEIDLTMSSGPRYFFGPATIKGATYYPEELLHRYIHFSTGDPFSYKALGKTQLNFAGSSYFKSVSVVPDKGAAAESQVPVLISVVPAPRRTIRTGIGYGTDTGARTSLGYKDLSLLSPGNTLTAEIAVAQRLQGIGAAYVIPSSSNIETFSTIQTNLQREDVNDTISKLASLELSRTTGFGDRRLGTAFIRLMHEEDRDGMGNSGTSLLLPGLRLTRQGYDDPIRPTKGYHYGLETRGAHRMIGSDSSFIQFIAESGVVIPLPWRLSIQSRIKGGTTLSNDTFAEIPTSLKFFAGGDNSVRGYAYKALGPQDASGDVVGGEHLLQGSIELERNFLEKWGISVFYDVGNAFDEASDLKLYQGSGVGLHYFTPIGSVNLSLARQISVPDPQFRVHFTIGFQL